MVQVAGSASERLFAVSAFAANSPNHSSFACFGGETVNGMLICVIRCTCKTSLLAHSDSIQSTIWWLGLGRE